MLLCLDAGNSRLKAGLWDGRAWRWDLALDYDELKREWPADLRSVRRTVACSVAGAAREAAIEELARHHGWPLSWLHAADRCADVHNGYRRPEQLGADRFAALLAAREEQVAASQRQPYLIVMAGTATTIDALDPDGGFPGGFILPGLRLMRDALSTATAQLPRAHGVAALWPTSTNEAIVGGSLIATLGAVERVRARLAASYGSEPVCLVGGGAADELLSEAVTWTWSRRPRLVLDGLRRYAESELVPRTD